MNTILMIVAVFVIVGANSIMLTSAIADREYPIICLTAAQIISIGYIVIRWFSLL